MFVYESINYEETRCLEFQKLNGAFAETCVYTADAEGSKEINVFQKGTQSYATSDAPRLCN